MVESTTSSTSKRAALPGEIMPFGVPKHPALFGVTNTSKKVFAAPNVNAVNSSGDPVKPRLPPTFNPKTISN